MATLLPIGPTDKTLFERNGVASGAIRRQDGQFREYSVLFLGSDLALDPAELGPGQLLGAVLENKELPASQKDRYYTIIGGYYFEKLADGAGLVTRLFGAAADASLGFNLTEGGNTLLKAEWELIHQSGNNKTNLLDETKLGKAGDPGTFGWSLIAEEVKPDNLRPKSGKTVLLFSRCPQITDLQAVAGQKTENTLVFQFTATLDTPGDATFTWDFGDGSTPETTTEPEVFHRFDRQEDTDTPLTVKVSITTPIGCQDQREIAIVIPPKCPSLAQIFTQFGPLQNGEVAVTFTAEFSDAKRPSTYNWYFGDGSAPETTTEPTVTHAYAVTGSTPLERQITLQTEGPGSCTNELTVPFTIPAGCPVITGVEVVYEVPGKTNQRVRFVVSTDGPAPEGYLWDFGNGRVETVPQAATAIRYDLPAGASQVLNATVTLVGPGPCEHIPYPVTVTIAGTCPEWQDLTYEQISLTTTELEVKLTAKVTGGTPDRYFWKLGEENEAETPSGEFTLTLPRPLDLDEQNEVSVRFQGPGECQGAPRTIQIPVPVQCPQLTGIAAAFGTTGLETQPITFTADWTGPTPSSFAWTFGDGQSAQTTGPEVSHEFARPSGDEEGFVVTVTATGPGTCDATTAQTEVHVPGVCPVISGVDTTYAVPDAESQQVTFAVSVQGPAPDRFEWTLPDGTTQSSESPTTQITFLRSPGSAATVQLSVQLVGPDTCRSGPFPVSVTIPGICPQWENLSFTPGELTETELEGVFTALVTGPAPTAFTWNVGEGQIFTTEGPSFTHRFLRPLQENSTRIVKVSFSGPGDCAGPEREIGVEVPVQCPKVLELTSEALTPSDLSQEIRFEVSVSGPQPASLIWNWGDGSPETSGTALAAAHVYQRKPGDPAPYEVTVRVLGPGTCESHGRTSVQVAGLCPEITSSQVTFGDNGIDFQEITLTLLVGKAQPERYIWDWGDGSTPETGSEPMRAHRYPRIPGDGKSYTATIRLEGPGACRTLGAVPVSIPGICPVWSGLTLAIHQTTDMEVLVQAQLDGNGILAEQYLWNWGDGSQAHSTRQPSASHLFTRQPGDPVAYTVSVTTTGPDSCQADLSGTISIPGICPEITGITPVFGQSDHLTQEVQVNLSLKSIGAQTYLWEWGDGQITETPTPSATHTYQRVAGVEKAFPIRVTGAGPGQCVTTATTQVSVGPLCPVVTDVQVSYGLTSPTTQEIGVQLTLSFGEGVKYVWEWGDGTEPVTTVLPTASRVFVRQPGDPKMYLIRVTAEGPGVCRTHATVQARVPGICPEVRALNAVYGTPDDQHQPVTLTAELQQAFEGLAFEWNWGDGTPPTLTTDAQASHSYARFPGDARAYTPKLVVRGPGSCETQVVTRVEIPGLCPSIVRVDVSPGIMTDEVYEVALTAQLAGPAPASLRWEWGDGSVDENAGAQITHLYQRQPGDAMEKTARLTVVGPGSCAASTEVTISVPGYCPVISDLALRELETEMETEYPVEASLRVARTPATSYLWEWGDGTSDVSETPEFTHVYARQLGVTGQFVLKMTASGPGSCESTLEIPVTVLGYCLTVEEIVVTLEPEEELTQEVSVALTLSPAEAVSYIWNWGDGSEPETTEAAYASHVYQRLPGDPVTYPIQVTFAGPGYCTGLAEAQARVNGLCPRVEAFDLILSDTFTLGDQPVEAELTLALTPAETYTWNWGDGHSTETNLPSAAHVYQRFAGDARTYAVSVHMTGPGSCITQAEGEVVIPGYCPVPLSLTVLPDLAGALSPKTHLKYLVLEVGDAPATTYRWDWGDDTVEELATPAASHTYLRPQGEKQEFAITVTLLGPDSCQSVIGTTVEIQGRCPILIAKNFETVAMRPLEEVIAFSLTLEDAGRVPEGSMDFEWTFDSPAGPVVVVTKKPEAELVLTRFAQDRLVRVDVKAKGPGICEVSTCFTVSLAGRCPVVESVEKQVCGTPESGFTYHFEAIFRAVPVPAGYPDRYIWNWGDGSPEMVTSVPEATHTFIQKESFQSLTAQVTLSGPDCDCGSTFSFPVEIPGECPLITGIYATYSPAIDGFQEVTLTPVVRNGRPQRYDWDFGDGSPVLKTAAHFVRHVFPLTQTAFIVRLTIQGAEGKAISCTHTFERRVELDLQPMIS